MNTLELTNDQLSTVMSALEFTLETYDNTGDVDAGQAREELNEVIRTIETTMNKKPNQITHTMLASAILSRLDYFGSDLAYEESKFMIQDAEELGLLEYGSPEADRIKDFFCEVMRIAMDDLKPRINGYIANMLSDLPK